MTVITRFAPSPTGFLHIGGARTALFNYLFAKHNGGKFLLRIEDTDKERSTEPAKEAILTSLKWLGLPWHGEVVYQSKRAARHKEIAEILVTKGKAYYCFSSQEEIAAQREEALKNKEHFIFKSPWRDKESADFPSGIKPVIRLKVSKEGSTTVKDLLQGDVTVLNSHIDDMILLRSDGTPTYMLAVVVDDHDMGITHIIRGDDHLTNASRQQVIYEAMGWDIPAMVHIPLIHGPDGAKLSKRHGALGAEQYKDMGFLPDALCNYLLRLGWSHGDAEFISRSEAIEWFSIEGLGKSPARLDFDKMRFMNAHYIRNLSDDSLLDIIKSNIDNPLSKPSEASIQKALPDIKARAELVLDLVNLAKFYTESYEIKLEEEAKSILETCDKDLVEQVISVLKVSENENSAKIQENFNQCAKDNNLKLGELMKYVRILITGQKDTPSMFNMISIIGATEAIRRISTIYDKK